MLLGIVDPVDMDECSLELFPGDGIVLYSDGMTDANSPSGQFFGRERLLAVVSESADATAGSLCDRIFQRVGAFQAGSQQYDDMALLVARLVPGS
jgi:sigma-B regulation protein RsbU (phosphoserine phosphatase)